MSDQSTEAGRSDTRDRIVETARQLFFEQGYTATGMAQILKASDAKSGSLYHFFPTKEDLLIAVLERYTALLRPAVLDPAYDRASDPIDRIFAVLDGYRRLLEATRFELGCPIGNLALEMSNSHPRVRELVVANFEGWRSAVRELIHAAANRFPEDVDPESLSHFTLATMEGAVMLARAYRTFDPFDAAIASLRDHFDRLVREGSDWSRPRPSQEPEP